MEWKKKALVDLPVRLQVKFSHDPKAAKQWFKPGKRIKDVKVKKSQINVFEKPYKFTFEQMAKMAMKREELDHKIKASWKAIRQEAKKSWKAMRQEAKKKGKKNV